MCARIPDAAATATTRLLPVHSRGTTAAAEQMNGYEQSHVKWHRGNHERLRNARVEPLASRRGVVDAAIATGTPLRGGALLDAAAVHQREWSDVLRTVHAGLSAVPSRAAQRLPHLTVHDGCRDRRRGARGC
jgi:hypothetical protein